MTARQKVLNCIRRYGPVSDERIEELTCLNPNTARPRRVELEREGFIADHLFRGTTRSGRPAILWVAIL